MHGTRLRLVMSSSLAALVATSSAYASPLHEQIRTFQHTASPQRAEKPAACADFSGNWLGRCLNSDGSTSENQQLRISQYQCDFMMMEGITIYFDGSLTSGHKSATGNQTSDTTIYAAWNPSRTAVQTLWQIGTQTSLFALAGLGTESFAIDDGKLRVISQMKDMIASTGENVPFTNSDCTYGKVP